MGRKRKKEKDQAISLFRRRLPSGALSKIYSVKFTLDGKQVLKSTGCHKEEAAQAWADEYVQDLRSQNTAAGLAETVRRIRTGGEAILLSEVFSRYKTWPRKKPPGEKQLAQRESVWNDFMAFLSEMYPSARLLSDITFKMAREYFHLLQTSGRFSKEIKFTRNGPKTKKVSYVNNSRELSAKTCNEYLLALRHIFGLLMEDAGLNENVFLKIDKMDRDDEHREAFTAKQLKQIGKRADSFLKPIFAIGICTGLREGDICTLRWDEVDLRERWITRKMKKTGKTVRIPIVSTLMPILKSLGQGRGGDYVLPEHAEMYKKNPSGISYRVKKFLEGKKDQGGMGMKTRRKIEGRTRMVSIYDVHSLRHTFVWIAALHGIPLPIVQSIVGHLTPEMTRRYADHATDVAKMQHLEALPNYLGLPGGNLRPLSDAERLEVIRELFDGEGDKEMTPREKQILKIIDGD